MRSNDDIEVRNCFRNLDVARISRVSDCDYRFHTLAVKFIFWLLFSGKMTEMKLVGDLTEKSYL